jgi:hypothetical protein
MALIATPITSIYPAGQQPAFQSMISGASKYLTVPRRHSRTSLTPGSGKHNGALGCVLRLDMLWNPASRGTGISFDI